MAAQQDYIVSARKYRPATFKTVVGQKALTATLKNAIKGGKLAQAYLFCGPRGVGKTSCARIFAKTINCQHPTEDGEACGECEICKAIERGNSFNLVELDAASNNSVDNIRNITEQVNIPAQDGRYRVFIIDEVHMLSNAAFNAFLKTLEEPPKNVVFILATTERHKVIPTILSRCQIYDFRRITVNDIIDHLAYVAENEGVEFEREALGVIALKADGAMRDALSIFDQIVASTHGHVTYQATLDSLNVLDSDYYFRLVDNFRNGDVSGALLTFKEITDKGFDAQFFINGLAEHIRNLMVSSDARTVTLLETSEELAIKYARQSPQMPIEWYYNAMKILNDADFNYKTSGNKRLLVELTLIKLSRLLMPEIKPPTQTQLSPVPSKEGKDNSVTPQATREVQNAPFVNPVGNNKKPLSAPENKPEANSKIRRSSAQRPISFRISAVSQPTASEVSEEPRSCAFTEEQFREVWNEYTTTHPDQRILTAAMRESEPKKLDSNVYGIVVSHPAQKQAFDSSQTELLEFLKGKLQNDFIQIRVEVNKAEEKDKGLSPKEFLKLTIEENPALAKFLKEIDAELE